jgi:tetrahydromethanopterin S-methyltransferase subunit A
METERTRRIVELINKLNSEQMDRLERFLREILGIKEEEKGG